MTSKTTSKKAKTTAAEGAGTPAKRSSAARKGTATAKTSATTAAGKAVTKATAVKTTVKSAAKRAATKAVAQKSTPAKKPAAKKPVAKKSPAPQGVVKSTAAKAAPVQAEAQSTAKPVAAAKAPAKTTVKSKAATVAKKSPAKKAVAAGAAKPAVRFSDASLAEFRALLMKLRNDLSGKVAYLHNSSLKRDDKGNPAEDGSDAFERLFALERAGGVQQRINAVDEALRKIDDGIYGICQSCEKLIGKQRLVALPFAHNCIECQASQERRRAGLGATPARRTAP